MTACTGLPCHVDWPPCAPTFGSLSAPAREPLALGEPTKANDRRPAHARLGGICIKARSRSGKLFLASLCSAQSIANLRERIQAAAERIKHTWAHQEPPEVRALKAFS